RRHANAAELSHDAIVDRDTAIFTGCYAAAQACRWHVTRDPDALTQVRHLARGLEVLSTVTGQPGCLARSVGRPLPGETVEGAWPSPTGSGLWFKGDVSRDQLAGVTLGWALIAAYVEDEALRAKAAEQMAAIARRLASGGMWLRDVDGRPTTYGELRPDVEHLPFGRNGPLAAIGLATMVVAAQLNPADGHLQTAVWRMDREGWDEALEDQYTFLPDLINSSNVHMVKLALLCLALYPHAKAAHYAKKGLRSLRAATVGWWNAGICACDLLAGIPEGRRSLKGEIRATLHALPAREEPRTLVQAYRGDTAAPIWQRQVSSWYWTNNVRWFHIWRPGGELPATVYWTGADWLFAYWLARAAGELRPRVGPGSQPMHHRCPVELPPWRRAPEDAEDTRVGR
ncbi:MAG: hypothetical protein ACYTG6_15545, partial [Planctomycetota bacterium]